MEGQGFDSLEALIAHFKLNKLPGSQFQLGTMCLCLEGKLELGDQLGSGCYGNFQVEVGVIDVGVGQVRCTRESGSGNLGKRPWQVMTCVTYRSS